MHNLVPPFSKKLPMEGRQDPHLWEGKPLPHPLLVFALHRQFQIFLTSPYLHVCETAEGEEEEEFDDDGSNTGKPCKDREKYAFKPTEENILVEWFQERKEFYDKSDSKFYAKTSKRKKLEALAKRLGCDVDKIEGWFRNQRTAVGKLMKCTKSGSMAQKRTPRQEWQLKSFTFLQEHIAPRTYTTEPTELGKASSSHDVHSESESGNEERPQSPAISSVATGGSRLGKRAKTSRLEDAMLKYFEQPRPSQDIGKQLQTVSRPVDTREAFGQYMTQYMHRIPDSRWDEFTWMLCSC
ncbi:uncharacterized protein LOC117530495 [Thalassophryne amazonica]|uniref:uncharacterized protein LOC117530495 n=1 Tax=Thalassophryne amazonica TaxID=390379 RepID=UPI001470A8CA|nr:uncharacterized protein LOC117530495 [Thalassophryne amazonica]